MARDREEDEHPEDLDPDDEDVGLDDEDDDLDDEDDEDLEDLDLDDDELEMSDDLELVGLDLDDIDLDDEDAGFDPDDDEDIDLKVAFGLPDRLPPLRLPPEPELAAMSRTSPLLSRARRLAEWVAPGRDLTGDIELTAGDTVAAARELGIAIPVEAGATPEALPGMPEPPAVTSIDDVPELARLWDIAFDLSFLEADVAGARVRPGAEMGSWPDGTDQEALDTWSIALPLVLQWLEDDADLDEPPGEQLDFSDVGWGLIVVLFLAGAQGVPVREASDIIREAATDELTPGQAAGAWKAWTRAHGDPAEDLLAQLAELGALSLSDQGSEQGPVARLTPLGTWAVRELLTEDGVEIPLLPPSTDSRPNPAHDA